MKVLVMSGYPDGGVHRDGVIRSDGGFLQKPFTLATLMRKVQESLRR
jgi:hypothetical protein